jgi:hypothetical protein
MIDTTEFYGAKINMETVILKMKASIEEIMKKNPKRIDLIESMTESMEDLIKFKSIFNQLEEHYYMECKTNLRLQMIIQGMKDEIRQYKIKERMSKEDI